MAKLCLEISNEGRLMTNFRLVREERDNSLWLVSCDADGRPIWYILGIHSDGMLVRCSGIGNEIGLSLDRYGKIRENPDIGG